GPRARAPHGSSRGRQHRVATLPRAGAADLCEAGTRLPALARDVSSAHCEETDDKDVLAGKRLLDGPDAWRVADVLRSTRPRNRRISSVRVQASAISARRFPYKSAPLRHPLVLLRI